MSCGCNSNPCSCQPRPSVCCTPTTESVEYTFENANANGIGVFDNETDNLVQFRGIVSANVSLTVTLNATDNTIVLSFDPSVLVADIPTATTTQRGIAETATNAEALAKAATDKIVTPSNFAAMASSTTFAGLVELATEAETIAGVSTTLAVTPAGLFAAGELTGMTTWADAVTRAGATPTFDGQLGVQLDTNIPYVANGAGAGDFDVPVLISGANVLSAVTTVSTTGFSFNFTGTGGVTIGCGLGVTSDASFSGTFTQFTAQLVNFESSVIQVDGASMPNHSILGTNGGGDLEALLRNTFISTANVQTGWSVTNPSVTRTLDVASADLATTRAVLGTLINDLKAVLLPAT